MPFCPSPPNVSIREYKKGGEPSPRAHYRVVPIAPAHFVSLPPHVNSWQIFTTQSFQPNSPYLTRELQRFRDYYNQQKCSTDQPRMWRRKSLLFFFFLRNMVFWHGCPSLHLYLWSLLKSNEKMCPTCEFFWWGFPYQMKNQHKKGGDRKQDEKFKFMTTLFPPCNKTERGDLT